MLGTIFSVFSVFRQLLGFAEFWFSAILFMLMSSAFSSLAAFDKRPRK
jgi:hypothetical protein